MSDLVAALRDYSRHDTDELMDKAADELDRLRAELDGIRVISNQVQMEHDLAIAELDRLRAEVSEWKMKYESEVALVDNVEAELDRLRAENGDHLAWIEHLKAENERLRSILTRTAQLVLVPRAQYDALIATAKALQDFWGFTQARGGEYHVVARQTMDALDALRAAGVEMGEATASAAAAADPE